MLENIEWLGHATFRIDKGRVVYIDPWKIEREEEADIILVSHDHYDHYSQEDIDKVRGPNTVVVTVPALRAKIGGDTRTMLPGDSIEIDGVRIEAVHAYNLDKKFHPKGNNWLGFIIGIDGERCYYAGDTDATPEVKGVREVDVALLPVGGTYTMDARQAADAAKAISPRVAVPYHWGDIVGQRSDAETFAEAYGGKTAILEKHS